MYRQKRFHAAAFLGWSLLLASLAAPTLAEPLVSWQQQLLKIDDPGPSLDIDTEGLVRVHVPAYLRGGGDFVFELDPAELARLRADLARLEGLDPASLRAERRRRLGELAASGRIPARAGSALSHFKIAGEIAGSVELTWRGLAFEAAWIGHADLQLLAELETRFAAWTLDERRMSVSASGEETAAGETP